MKKFMALVMFVCLGSIVAIGCTQQPPAKKATTPETENKVPAATTPAPEGQPAAAMPNEGEKKPEEKPTTPPAK